MEMENADCKTSHSVTICRIRNTLGPKTRIQEMLPCISVKNVKMEILRAKNSPMWRARIAALTLSRGLWALWVQLEKCRLTLE